MSEQMKLKDAMRQNPEFAEKVKHVVASLDWNLKEIENLSKAAYLELLMIESEEILKDLERMMEKNEHRRRR